MEAPPPDPNPLRAVQSAFRPRTEEGWVGRPIVTSASERARTASACRLNTPSLAEVLTESLPRLLQRTRRKEPLLMHIPRFWSRGAPHRTVIPMTAIPLVEVSAVVVALAGDDSSHRSRS